MDDNLSDLPAPEPLPAPQIGPQPITVASRPDEGWAKLYGDARRAVLGYFARREGQR